MKIAGSILFTRIVIAFAIIVFLGIAIQFYSGNITNPPVTGKIAAPPQVSQIIERSCYACHSNETKLQWYDKVAPVSWLVNSDIKKARKAMNFSEWDKLSPADQQAKVWYMLNMIQAKKMPLKTYTALHPEAVITTKDIHELENYALSLSATNPADTARINAASREYNDWKKKQKTSYTPISPNGISYFDDWKKWEVINTTYRQDGNTTRIIYGNKIAVKAIAENTINPWPDGAILAKVVWNEIQDSNGYARPGTFNNVQFMVKDATRFKNTEGWGFAKFLSLDKKPYGEPGFDNACISCHRNLAKNNGYVFDIPLKIDRTKLKWYAKK